MMTTIQVTDATFNEDVLQSEQPVLVDFWAPWCGPCRLLSPELEKLAKELSGKVKIAKINVDQDKKMAAKYQVRGIPHMKLFHKGKDIATSVGYKPAAELKKWIDQQL